MSRVARRALSLLTASALLAGLFLGTPAPVLATPQTFYVGHHDNDYVPGSECADPDYWTDGDWTGGGPYNSDNDAIQDAADNAASGSVIYICAGTYVFAEVVTIGAGKSLTFRGDGDQTVLDGNDITRIFNSSPVEESDQGGVLSLRDLLIMDAEVTEWNAGAIVADGLSLDNVTITRTTGAYNGGALYAEGNVTIVDSTFTGNIALADGGVLYAWNGDRTVSISNSVFDENTAGFQGGAILATNVTVTGSTFTDNSAFVGGAIFATTTATVTNSTFTDNDAAFSSGGAIFAPTATVTNSTFRGNDAASSGGAITSSTATVTSSNFTDNNAYVGGAISSDTTATVSNSTFTNNDANGNGGAIYAGTGTVSNSTFTNNDANDDGGAIYAGTGTIARSRFARNTAGQHGGAINLYGSTSQDLRRLRRNTFSRNTAPAGGAMTLGPCGTPSRSQAARVQRANRFSGNRATEQRRTNNIERLEGGCG
jgi:predicted outer membrane repeat protein